MTLDIRITDDPHHFDLYDADDKIGEILCDPPDADDPTDIYPPYWSAELWSQMGTGKEWSATGESFDEVKRYAHELYEQFAAERRDLSKGSRIWTTGSVPMGGKPGWRRR